MLGFDFTKINWSDPTIVVELIKILPTCFLLLLVIVILIIFQGPLRKRLTQLTHVDLAGVKIDFAEAKAELRNALATYPRLKDYRQGKSGITEEDLLWLLKYAERIRDLLQSSRILWVDDHPLANATIFRFLRTYGVDVDYAYTTEEAINALKWSATAYEVVVTDIKRPESDRAGLELLEKINLVKKGNNLKIMVIIFVNDYDSNRGLPRGAAMMTNKVDELLAEIFAIIEQKQLRQLSANEVKAAKI